jgi:O-antigen/teichoic acid export membrane protein
MSGSVSPWSFFRDTGIYGLSVLLSRGIGIFLLPIYARFLSPQEYGIIELLTAGFAILNLVLPLEVSQAVARFMPEAKDNAAKSAYAATTFWYTALVFAVFTAAVWAAPRASGEIWLGSGEHAVVMKFAVLAMLGTALLYVVQNHLRWCLQASGFAIVGVIFAAISAVVSVMLIVAFGLGVLGYICGQIVGSFVALAAGLQLAKRTVPIQVAFDRAKFGEMLRFSAPLVLSSISVYMSTYMDRWMLRGLLGLDDVGIYGVAYRVASIVALVIVGFQMALTPFIYQHYRDPETPQVIRRIFVYFLMVVLPAVMFLGTFSREIVTIIAGPSFNAASNLVVWLVCAVVLMNVYIFAPGMGLAKKTKKIALANGIAALVNVSLNALWIPAFGRTGAAMATFVSGLTMASLYFFWSYKEYPIPYKTSRSAAAVVVMIAFLLLAETLSISSFVRFAMWLLCSALIVLTLLDNSDRRLLLERFPIWGKNA